MTGKTVAARVSAVLMNYPRLRAILKTIWYFKKYLFRRREGVVALTATYARVHGRPLDLEHPVRFTDKLFCRMIEWHREGCGRFTDLADKFRVRPFVAEKVGEQYLAKLHWSGKDVDQIPYDQLPARYVIKTNHGSAQVIRVNGQVDRAQTAISLKSWLSTNHYWKEREYQYLHIRPRILVEEYLDDENEAGPLDYRFWCFGGAPAAIQVDNHRHDINPFYDRDWQALQLSYRTRFVPIAIPRPENLDSMISVASRLAADFDFVRVDLYNVGGRIVFGELTFTPVAGFLRFQPDAWDIELGRLWQ